MLDIALRQCFLEFLDSIVADLGFSEVEESEVGERAQGGHLADLGSVEVEGLKVYECG